MTEYVCENVFDCINLLKRGEKFRKTSQTRKNEMSSRSHTIFIMIFEGGKIHQNGTLKVIILINKLFFSKFQRDLNCIFVI